MLGSKTCYKQMGLPISAAPRSGKGKARWRFFHQKPSYLDHSKSSKPTEKDWLFECETFGGRSATAIQ